MGLYNVYRNKVQLFFILLILDNEHNSFAYFEAFFNAQFLEYGRHRNMCYVKFFSMYTKSFNQFFLGLLFFLNVYFTFKSKVVIKLNACRHHFLDGEYFLTNF